MRIKNLVSKPEKFPELFEHYSEFWSDKTLPFETNNEKIKLGEKLVLEGLLEIEKLLTTNSIPANEINIVLFVGQNVANGHAALLKGEWWVWLPVETYSSKEQVLAFVTHEIIHALHYRNVPDFYFTNKQQKQLTGRQVMTEGVAMLLTKKFTGLSAKQTLWADFLTDEKYLGWNSKYENSKTEIIKLVLDQWDSNAKGLFQANSANDIFNFRVGYAIAMEAVEDVFLNFQNILQLLTVPYDQFEESIKSVLKELK